MNQSVDEQQPWRQRGTHGLRPRVRAPIVRFENVALDYGGERDVLHGLDFTIDEGGFYFLTGPSGAGKTSLLRLLYLAAQPSRGRITLFGDDTGDLTRADLPALRRRIGVVFQDFLLVPHLSVFDNVSLPLRITGKEDATIRASVEEMLDWVGLSPQRDALPATLSGGEQQRVAIARAVIACPALLVADEPTGNVDPDLAQRLLSLFKALNEAGTAVIVATHDVQLMAGVPHALLMRLDQGTLRLPADLLRVADSR